jgi:hypothetical protein
MDDQTPNLGLPFVLAAQAQKHVTHNEAIRLLDTLVQLVVVSRGSAAPPEQADEGDRYIVAAAASDAWAERSGQIAVRQDDAWAFLTPRQGWLAWVEDEERLCVWDGAEWRFAAAADISFDPVTGGLVGINTTADAVNRLAVKADAVLFSHDDVTPGSGDVRAKLNKAASTGTASCLFQSGWSGRAEFGLCGSDDFHLKVSADGTSWHEALVVDRTSGTVSFPGGGAREMLKANRTYHVSTAGSDAADGLSASSAFATPQRAMDVISGTLDLGVYSVTVQMADGTYAAALHLKSYLSGGGTVTFAGNAANRTAVQISAAGNAVYTNTGDIGRFILQNMKVSGTTRDVYIEGFGGSLTLTGVTFGGAGVRWLQTIFGGYATLIGSNYVDNGTEVGFWATRRGMIVMSGSTLVFNNSTVLSARLMNASEQGWLDAHTMTFTNPGNVTGKRYEVNGLGGIFTNGGGSTYFPGTVAGTAANGGVYY